MKKAWKLFSIRIRKSAANWAGQVECITCGDIYQWDSGMIHAGHWIHDMGDFNEKNIHPQCRNCNFKYNKNANTAYAVFMAQTYGVKGMKKIRKEVYAKGNAYTVKELEGIIRYETQNSNMQ